MAGSAESSGTVEILKQAIILEKRGFAFYQNVADQAVDASVKAFFDSMAQEEVDHIKVLSAQFKAYGDTGHFKGGTFNESDSSKLPSAVLNVEIQKKISAAGFEASAISAAIAMEQRAIDVYSQQAEKALDPEEKKMYAWLASWEREHLNTLMEIDRALLDQVWEDNHFWPF